MHKLVKTVITTVVVMLFFFAVGSVAASYHVAHTSAPWSPSTSILIYYPPAKQFTTVTEDSALWKCDTMGNRICGGAS